MPQFGKQCLKPLTPSAYAKEAIRARDLAEEIHLHRKPQSARERSQLTRAIHNLARAAANLSRRHRMQCVAEHEGETS